MPPLLNALQLRKSDPGSCKIQARLSPTVTHNRPLKTMRTSFRTAFLSGVLLVSLAEYFSLPVLAVAIGAQSSDTQAELFLSGYCVSCHGPASDESEFRLDMLPQLPLEESRAGWHQIHRKLSEKEMPPDDAEQPDDRSRTRLLDWIVETFGDPDAESEKHWAFQPVTRPPVPRRSGPEAPANAIDAFILAALQQQGLKPSEATDRRTLLRRVTLDLIGLPPTLEELDTFINDSEASDVAYARVVDRLLESPRYGERWAQHWLDVIRWAETVGFETNAERTDAWHYRDWVIKSLNKDKPYDEFVFEQLAGDTVGTDAALGFLVAGPANLPGQIGRDEQAMRQARQDELDEVIRTVSQSLFGLTIGCARCHDHKFDPIKQRDYYSMQAIFAGLSYGNRRLRGPQNDRWTEQIPEARHQLALLKEELARSQNQFNLRAPVTSTQWETFKPIRVDAVRMEIESTDRGPASLYEFEVWTSSDSAATSTNVAGMSSGGTVSASSFALANQTRHFDNLIDGSIDKRQAFPWVAAESGPAWLQVDLSEPATIDRICWHAGSSTPASYLIKAHEVKSSDWITVAHTRDRLPRIEDMRTADQVSLEGMNAEQVGRLMRLLARIRTGENQLRRLVNGPQVYAASFSAEPAATWLLHRGDPMQATEQVPPAVPGLLREYGGEAHIKSEIDRRLLLAHHITHPDHPLTSRVIVNRIWQYHFGTGLVDTPSDFGIMGAGPSHPELLDWLAVEFVERGWSLKQLHRMIVMSDTYQQTSRPRVEAIAIDADSRLLWRFPPRRLSAEAIHDSILAVSGRLNRQMYGRGFDFFDRRGGLSNYNSKETFDTNGWRRMVYAHKIRMERVDIFGAFDCPDAGQMTPTRNRSITSIQSLGLFNSPFTDRQADFFAERIAKETSGNRSQQVERAFELAYARRPTREELDIMVDLEVAHGMKQVCRVILNSSEFVFLN